jgi:hypothetical protein
MEECLRLACFNRRPLVANIAGALGVWDVTVHWLTVGNPLARAPMMVWQNCVCWAALSAPLVVIARLTLTVPAPDGPGAGATCNILNCVVCNLALQQKTNNESAT